MISLTLVSVANVSAGPYPNDILLYAHTETTTIGGTTYYRLRTISGDTGGTTLSQSAGSTGHKIFGRWVYPLAGVSSIPAGTWTFYYRVRLSGIGPVARACVDIHIRTASNTIRTTIATSAAKPASNIPTTWTTQSGTYSWATYTVVDQTDYLEIDFCADVTTPQSGRTVQLRVDDRTLGLTLQTRADTTVPYPSFDLAEKIPVSDALTRSFAASRSTSDDVPVSDALGRVHGASRSITESIPVADALSRLALLYRSILESATISDAVNRVHIATRSIAESVGIADVLNRVITFPRSITESIPVADALAKAFSGSRSLTDNAVISDALSRIKKVFVSLAESVAVIDALSRIMAFIRNIAEEAAISDNIGRLSEFARNVTADISVNDSLGALKHFLRTISEAIPVADLVAGVRSFLRAIIESIPIVDSILGMRPQVYNVVWTDSRTYGTGQTVTVNARFYDLLGNPITTGEATFRVAGPVIITRALTYNPALQRWLGTTVIETAGTYTVTATLTGYQILQQSNYQITVTPPSAGTVPADVLAQPYLLLAGGLYGLYTSMKALFRKSRKRLSLEYLPRLGATTLYYLMRWMIPAIALSYLVAFNFLNLYPLQVAYSTLALELLKTLGVSAHQTAPTVISLPHNGGMAALEVTAACVGWAVIANYIGLLMMPNGISTKRRLKGLVYGLGAISFANLTRIIFVSLAITVQGPNAIISLDFFLWDTAITAVAVLTWFVWLRRSSEQPFTGNSSFLEKVFKENGQKKN